MNSKELEAIRRYLDEHKLDHADDLDSGQLMNYSRYLLAALDASNDKIRRSEDMRYEVLQELDALKAALEPIADGAAETLHEARTIAQEALS